MLGRLLRRLLAVGPVLALAIACASPTLPLPPPEAPFVEPASDADHVKLTATCGGAESGATIVIRNMNPSVPGDQAVAGAAADVCGAWDAVAYAHRGDLLHIFQIAGTIISPAQSVLVP